LKKHFEAKAAELAQAQEMIAQVQAQCAQSSQRLELQVERSEHLQTQIARLESDYAAAREELSQLRGQFAPLAEAAAEAARVKGDRAAAQPDTPRRRGQAASPADGAAIQAQLSALEVERRQLHGELEALRQRASELSEALAEAQRHAATE